MNEVSELFFRAMPSGAFQLASVRDESTSATHVEPTASSPLLAQARVGFGPGDFIFLTLWIALFAFVAALGRMTFSVEQKQRRLVPIRIRTESRLDRDSRWR